MMAVPNGHDEVLDYDENGEEVMDTDQLTVSSSVSKSGSDSLRPYVGSANVHSVNFKDFLLKPELLTAIKDAGFEHPSEVQAECIPKAVLGLDVICQAKSGMGKTAVFVISTLQAMDASDPKQPSVICVSPTRELAFQIALQYRLFKKELTGIKLALFYGGVSTGQDIAKLKGGDPCHIIVGTPGRLLALIKEKALDLSHIKHFIIDECDKMLAPVDMRDQVQQIFQATPATKQVLMFSATLPKGVLPACRNFASDNVVEIVVEDQTKLVLERLRQFYVKAADEDGKLSTTAGLLDLLEFNQVIIFVNTVDRAGKLGKSLTELNYPVITIHSAMTQEERLARYQQFKTFNKRILVATDLFGRGMDIERVNVVINYDTPQNSDVYLHRIARAGRFNSKGLAVTIVTTVEDSMVMNKIQDRFDICVDELPDEIDADEYST